MIVIKTLAVATGLILLGLASSPWAEEPDPKSNNTKTMKLTLVVGNRVFPDFRETHATQMHKREYIGDTEYSFEVVEFYPHFAYLDSTKEVVSLSDEPKNVAFKVTVYENDEVVQSEWAFFNLLLPHYTMKSIIWFDVVEFEYRGEVYKKEQDEGEEKEEL
jgi:hypothetical protein